MRTYVRTSKAVVLHDRTITLLQCVYPTSSHNAVSRLQRELSEQDVGLLILDRIKQGSLWWLQGEEGGVLVRRITKVRDIAQLRGKWTESATTQGWRKQPDWFLRGPATLLNSSVTTICYNIVCGGKGGNASTATRCQAMLVKETPPEQKVNMQK